MARLPQPGGDKGSWGDILNDFLSQAHDSDGTLKADSVGAPQLKPNSVTTAALAPDSVTSSQVADNAIDENQLTPAVQTKLNAPGAVSSVATRTGDVVLAKGDVGLDQVDNTSDINKPISSATQTALNAKEPTIPAGSTAQYYRGDKTFQTLDKTAVGLANVDNTSDANKPVSTAQATADNLRIDKPIGPMQFVIYGASQSVTPGLRCTPGKEWFNQVATALGTTIATFAYSGRRTTDMAGYALSGTTPVTGQGAHPSGAAATWSGMDTVGKIPIIDTSINDIGHYPSMAVSPAVPALITGAAGARYVAGIGGGLRALLATMFSQSRIENTAATSSTGVWTTAVGLGSAGSTIYSTAVGATLTYTVTPPQGGEFAGDVHHVGVTLSTESGFVSAPFTYSIDGGAESALQTPPGWQRYVGYGGANVDTTPFVTKITLPVDGASHTIRITHAGSAGQFLYSDCLLIPSETPKPILVLAAPRQVKVGTGVFDAAGVATYARNWRVIEDQQKAICAEFPSAIYIPCNVTINGLSNVDGLHFNDRGMEQRANDALGATYANASVRAVLLGNKSRAAADGNYATL